MRESAEPSDPEPRSIPTIVADLHAEMAFGITTPEGERVCVMDRRMAMKKAATVRESAYKAYTTILDL